MNVSTLSATDFARLCNENTNLDVIDVRTPAEFREVHLESAKNIPLHQLDPAAVMRARSAEDEQPLYLVCQAGGRGSKACEAFHAAGFTNVVNIEGGTKACIEAGLPVVRGPGTVSLERQVRIAAGALVLIGCLLAWFVHPFFLALSIFVGAGLMFAGITDTCGMAIMLSYMPWNQCSTSCSTDRSCTSG
jgi:rhodanese-related sulfurtransferase